MILYQFLKMQSKQIQKNYLGITITNTKGKLFSIALQKIITSMYFSPYTFISFDEIYTEIFETKFGFMQEDPLCRILFKIYINDIPILLKIHVLGKR